MPFGFYYLLSENWKEIGVTGRIYSRLVRLSPRSHVTYPSSVPYLAERAWGEWRSDGTDYGVNMTIEVKEVPKDRLRRRWCERYEPAHFATLRSPINYGREAPVGPRDGRIMTREPEVERRKWSPTGYVTTILYHSAPPDVGYPWLRRDRRTSDLKRPTSGS